MQNQSTNNEAKDTTEDQSDDKIQEESQNTDPLPSTSPQQNWSNTKDYLITVASCMYCTILVTFGLALQVSIPFIGMRPVIYYCIIICCIGMAYHVYLLTDIGRYVSILIKNERAEGRKIIRMEGGAHDCTPVIGEHSRKDQSTMISYPRDYCFKYGRHSGSLFLKTGAAALACGHVVHSVLLITVQITQFFDDSVNNEDCVVIEQIVLDILEPTNLILQVYFIFKYSKIVIMKRKDLAHWAIMHIIGTCLCFWLVSIIRETILALIVYANSVYGMKALLTTRSMIYLSYLSDSEKFLNPLPEPRLFNVSNFYNAHCAGDTLMMFVQHVSPHLYPFCIESNVVLGSEGGKRYRHLYGDRCLHTPLNTHKNNIALYEITVAIYFIMWKNINHCPNYARSEIVPSMKEHIPICRIPPQDTLQALKTTFHNIYKAASQTSAIIALVVMVIIAGTLVLGYIFSKVGGEFVMVGHLLREATMLGLHLILLAANLMAFNNLRKLDINEHPISVLDDVLLFLCIPAFTLELTLSLVATSNKISSMNYVIMGLEMFVQTLTIMDGLRRCSNTIEMQQAKPGRDIVAFLVVINIGMWIHYTFSHSSDHVDERNIFYGQVTWAILGHVSLPLIMFYRFHSSVCFADIWKSAYKPGARH